MIRRWLTFVATVYLLIGAELVTSSSARRRNVNALQATSRIRIFGQDGLSFSTIVFKQLSPLPTDIELFSFDSWPRGFSKIVFAFYGGVFDGTSVWFVPCYADRVVKIDVGSGEMTGHVGWPLGFVRPVNAFVGGVFDGDSVWLLPCGADRFVKIDSAGSMTGVRKWPVGFVKSPSAFYGGVFDGNLIWLPPYNADRIVKFHTETEVVEGFKTWPSGFTKSGADFIGAAFDGSNIWMVPLDNSAVLRFDISSEAMSQHDDWPVGFTKGFSSFRGGVYDGQSVWMVPADATHLVKIDTKTTVMTGYDKWPLGFTKIGGAFCGGMFDGENVWLAPQDASSVVRVLASTGTMTAISSWPQTFQKSFLAFRGAVYDGESIWLVPHNAKSVIRIARPSTTEPVSTLPPVTIASETRSASLSPSADSASASASERLSFTLSHVFSVSLSRSASAASSSSCSFVATPSSPESESISFTQTLTPPLTPSLRPTETLTGALSTTTSSTITPPSTFTRSALQTSSSTASATASLSLRISSTQTLLMTATPTTPRTTTFTHHLTMTETHSETETIAPPKSPTLSISITPMLAIPVIMVRNWVVSEKVIARGAADGKPASLNLDLSGASWNCTALTPNVVRGTMQIARKPNRSDATTNLKANFDLFFPVTFSDWLACSATTLTILFPLDREFQIDERENVSFLIPIKQVLIDRPHKIYLDFVKQPSGFIVENDHPRTAITVPKVVTASAEIAGEAGSAVSIAAANPGVAMQAHRTTALLAMAECDDNTEDLPLDFMTSPTGISLSHETPRLDLYAGAALMNPFIFLGCVVAHGLIAGGHSLLSGRPLGDSFAILKFPGFQYAIFMVLLQPTVMAATTILRQSTEPLSLFLGVMVFILIASFIACVTWEFCSAQRFAARCLPRSDESLAKQSCLASFFLGRMKWTSLPQFCRLRRLSHHSVQKVSFGRTESLDEKVRRTGSWRSAIHQSPPEWSEPAPRPGSFMLKYFSDYVRCFGPMFDIYRANYQWFCSVELVLTVMLGVLEGWRPTSDAGCTVVINIAAISITAFFIALCVARPYVTWFETVFAFALIGTQFASALCLWAYHSTQARTMPIWVNISVVSSIGGLLFTTIKAVGDLLLEFSELYSWLRRTWKRKTAAATEKPNSSHTTEGKTLAGDSDTAQPLLSIPIPMNEKGERNGSEAIRHVRHSLSSASLLSAFRSDTRASCSQLSAVPSLLAARTAAVAADDVGNDNSSTGPYMRLPFESLRSTDDGAPSAIVPVQAATSTRIHQPESISERAYRLELERRLSVPLPQVTDAEELQREIARVRRRQRQLFGTAESAAAVLITTSDEEREASRDRRRIQHDVRVRAKAEVRNARRSRKQAAVDSKSRQVDDMRVALRQFLEHADTGSSSESSK